MELVGSLKHKPHSVCIPFPFQGHIKPMMKLAKLLHHKGFHITYVNTEFNHKRMLESAGQSTSLDGLPDFQFVTIPDGLPPSSDPHDPTEDFLSLCNNFSTPFRNLVAKLNDTAATSKVVPPVTYIIADICLVKFPVTVAEELGIPITLFSTSAACFFMVIGQYRALKEKGLVPLKDESYLTNGYLDTTTIDWVPGMKEIRLRDLPGFLFTTDPKNFMINFTKQLLKSFPRDCPAIFHTFDALEQDVLDALTHMLPNSYVVGPLQLLLNQIPENPSNSIGDVLWKEDIECLQWLNSWPPNSVVYVSFGSSTVMTPEELVEFGWGLANSEHPFLWIIRPEMVIGDAAILPPEFVTDTKERGMVASWCPQEAVLNHHSVGGFLTHCGWNSIVESVSAGVPMLCWPFFADQPVNCRYTCTELGIGMEIGGNVKRSEVEKLVRELMEGEKGKKMKKNVMELRKKAEESTAPNGSSSTNLDKVVKKLLSSKK